MMQHCIAAFSRTLMHSLWQGLVFAIIAGVVLLCTRGTRSALRYAILLGSFFILTGVISFTFLLQWNDEHLLSGIFYNPVLVAADNRLSLLYLFTGFLDSHSVLLVIVWALVFAIKSLRMTGSLLHTNRLRTTVVKEAPAYWREKIAGLSGSLGIKKTVLLLESGLVKIPVVIGHLKPFILMPAGLLTQLPAGELEAVLIHELAHIRRNDYIINVLQHCMENLFFFNPGLLWISALLREERENCCDDIAIAATNDKKQFIEALISFKEYAMHTRMLVTAFPSRRNLMLLRVQRIVYNRNNPLNPVEQLFIFCSFLVVLLLFSVMGGRTVASTAKKWTLPVVQKKAIGTAPVPSFVELQKKSIKPMPDLSGGNAVVQNAATYEQPDEPGEAQHDQETATLTEKEMAEADRLQSVVDRRQAESDRLQAIGDKAQTDKDRVQALLDREQADKDRTEAEEDKFEADRNAAAAKKIKVKAVKAHHLESGDSTTN